MSLNFIYLFTANPENIETALKLILEIIKGDPQSSSCLTINYSNAGGHSNNRDEYNEDYGDDSGKYGGGGGGKFLFFTVFFTVI